MKSLLFLSLFISLKAIASLSSPFPSSVEGLSIKNSHQVSHNIYRGMNPLGKIDELINFDITDIIIFKNQTRTEIDDQYLEMENKSAQMMSLQVDFLWHKYPSYKVACEQTLQALTLMREVNEDSNRKLFFHCTVGEDRTGHLAGLWRMLSQGWSMRKAFYNEMCENGYANGNPQKPDYVVGEIRKDLTPLFMYMAQKIESGELSLGVLSKATCQDEIPAQKILRCKSSSRYSSDSE